MQLNISKKRHLQLFIASFLLMIISIIVPFSGNYLARLTSGHVKFSSAVVSSNHYFGPIYAAVDPPPPEPFPKDERRVIHIQCPVTMIYKETSTCSVMVELFEVQRQLEDLISKERRMRGKLVPVPIKDVNIDINLSSSGFDVTRSKKQDAPDILNNQIIFVWTITAKNDAKKQVLTFDLSQALRDSDGLRTTTIVNKEKAKPRDLVGKTLVFEVNITGPFGIPIVAWTIAPGFFAFLTGVLGSPYIMSLFRNKPGVIKKTKLPKRNPQGRRLG